MADVPHRPRALGLIVFALSALVGCDPGGDVIGPAGGLVVSEDGRLRLSVPAGALDDEVAISIHAVDSDLDGPTGLVHAYAIEPVHTPLGRPATVEFDWRSSAGLSSAAPEHPAATRLLIERGPNWSPLADLTVDPESWSAAASAHYLGVVAIVVQ